MLPDNDPSPARGLPTLDARWKPYVESLDATHVAYPVR